MGQLAWEELKDPQEIIFWPEINWVTACYNKVSESLHKVRQTLWGLWEYEYSNHSLSETFGRLAWPLAQNLRECQNSVIKLILIFVLYF